LTVREPQRASIAAAFGVSMASAVRDASQAFDDLASCGFGAGASFALAVFGDPPQRQAHRLDQFERERSPRHLLRQRADFFHVEQQVASALGSVGMLITELNGFG
jgi:hypothetical protein